MPTVAYSPAKRDFLIDFESRYGARNGSGSIENESLPATHTYTHPHTHTHTQDTRERGDFIEQFRPTCAAQVEVRRSRLHRVSFVPSRAFPRTNNVLLGATECTAVCTAEHMGNPCPMWARCYRSAGASGRAGDR